LILIRIQADGFSDHCSNEEMVRPMENTRKSNEILPCGIYRFYKTEAAAMHFLPLACYLPSGLPFGRGGSWQAWKVCRAHPI